MKVLICELSAQEKGCGVGGEGPETETKSRRETGPPHSSITNCVKEQIHCLHCTSTSLYIVNWAGCSQISISVSTIFSMLLNCFTLLQLS